MGLAGRKEKQRIPKDPRNLAWSENAAKFGHTYLAKLGWDPTLGLGVAKDGRTTNIAVAQKLDQLGIGAGRSGNASDPDGVAWKQQNDYERMLARLNAQTQSGDVTTTKEKEGVVSTLGFVASSSTTIAEPGAATDDAASTKKRKRSQFEIEEDLSQNTSADSTETVVSTASAAAVIADVPVAPPPRRFAHHRARLLNAKKISSKSAAELSEVLGVASSSSTPTPNVATPPIGTLTPISDEPDTKITTSTKSMSDYFKEKMAKLKNKHQWMADGEGVGEGSAAVETSQAPEPQEDEERPRFGLGSRHTDTSALSAFVKPSFQSASSSTFTTTTKLPPNFATLSNEASTSTPPSLRSDPTASSDPSSEDTASIKAKKDKKEKKSKKRSKDSTPDIDAPKNDVLLSDSKRTSKKHKKDKHPESLVADEEAPSAEATLTMELGSVEPPPKKTKKSKVSTTDDDTVAKDNEDDVARRRRKEEKRAKKRAKEGKA